MLQNVIVNRGELLLLNLVPGANGAEWRRAFVTRDDYGDKPGESSGDWRLAAVQNQRLKDRGLQMLLMLDKAPERAEATLQQQRPRETWLEVGSSAGSNAAFDLRWGYQPGYAAPAWNVESPEWPTVRGTQTAAQPLVRMWWSPVLDTPPDAFVARSLNCCRCCTLPTSAGRWRRDGRDRQRRGRDTSRRDATGQIPRISIAW